MKTRHVLGFFIALAVAVALGGVAEAKAKSAGPAPQASPGAVVVEELHMTATVKSVDPGKHKLTLTLPDGSTKTFKVSNDVMNLEQAKPGDLVAITYVDELAVFLRKANAPVLAAEKEAVVLAPRGSKPGGEVVETEEVVAKVKAIDPKARKVTLVLPSGESTTLKVSPSVEHLDEVKAGDDVVIRRTARLIVDVQKK